MRSGWIVRPAPKGNRRRGAGTVNCNGELLRRSAAANCNRELQRRTATACHRALHEHSKSVPMNAGAPMRAAGSGGFVVGASGGHQCGVVLEFSSHSLARGLVRASERPPVIGALLLCSCCARAVLCDKPLQLAVAVGRCSSPLQFAVAVHGRRRGSLLQCVAEWSSKPTRPPPTEPDSASPPARSQRRDTSPGTLHRDPPAAPFRPAIDAPSRAAACESLLATRRAAHVDAR